MNAIQTARHDMFYAVLTEGDNRPEVVALIPEFKKGYDRFKNYNRYASKAQGRTGARYYRSILK